MRISVRNDSTRLSSPKDSKLTRRAAASTAFLGFSKNMKKHKLHSPGGPIKALWKPRGRSSTKTLRQSSSSTAKLFSAVTKRDVKAKNCHPEADSNLNKEKEVKELKVAIQFNEIQTEKLKHKIKKFEKMFGLLYRTLEEGEGTHELKKISAHINKELNQKSFDKNKKGHSKCQSLLIAPKNRFLVSPSRKNKAKKIPVHDQLHQVKTRTSCLMNYLKKY